MDGINDWLAAHENTDTHAAHDNVDSHAAHEFLLECNTRSLTRVCLCSTRCIARVQHTKYGLRALHEFYSRAEHFVSHACAD